MLPRQLAPPPPGAGALYYHWCWCTVLPPCTFFSPESWCKALPLLLSNTFQGLPLADCIPPLGVSRSPTPWSATGNPCLEGGRYLGIWTFWLFWHLGILDIWAMQIPPGHLKTQKSLSGLPWNSARGEMLRLVVVVCLWVASATMVSRSRERLKKLPWVTQRL